MPIVYILTNETMPDLVKIGHTDRDLEKRIKELDTTGVPLPFECFYAVKVETLDAAVAIEKKIHQGLDECRIRDRREFFETSAESATALLKVAEVMGGVDVTPKDVVVDDPQDKQDLERAHKRGNRFQFSMLGIEPGEWLQFKKDNTIQCEVVNDTQVRFRDEVTSLSTSANTIIEEMGYDWGGKVRGPAFWCWQGRTLLELRSERDV